MCIPFYMTKLEYHSCSRPRSQQPFPQMLRDLKVFIVISVDVLVDRFRGVGQVEIVYVLGNPVQESCVSGHSRYKMLNSLCESMVYILF